MKINLQTHQSSLSFHFSDNAIGYESFLTLTSEEIKELVPKIGYRKIFSDNHSRYVMVDKVCGSVSCLINMKYLISCSIYRHCRNRCLLLTPKKRHVLMV